MKQQWSEAELNTHWVLDHSEHTLIKQRTEHSQLGFAILLKYFQLESRFPGRRNVVPKAVVVFIAEQLDIDSHVWSRFSFSGRTAKRIRVRIRQHLGFRPATVEDAALIQQWLVETVISEDQEAEYLKHRVFDWCKSHKIEPPTKERIERLVAGAIHTFETHFFSSLASQLPAESISALERLLGNTNSASEDDNGKYQNPGGAKPVTTNSVILRPPFLVSDTRYDNRFN